LYFLLIDQISIISGNQGLQRPPGRPRKRRIKPSDETKKKNKLNKCSRCGLSGHHKNTCKNVVPSQRNEDSKNMQAKEIPTIKRFSYQTQ
jgi:hypothetical protein